MSTLVMALIITTLILALTVMLIWSVLSFTDVQDSDYDKEMMENWNFFKWIAYGVSGIWNTFVEIATWKPKTGIDKEIEEEEKEIAELERQKEKMERLSELKRRKERLFNDVGDTLKREELNSDIAVSFSGNKNRLDVEFISGWHKVYYSHAYNLDEIKQAIYDGKPIIEEDVRL